jgi:peptidoglycan/LPS O-acetylase OafA/YrhL
MKRIVVAAAYRPDVDGLRGIAVLAVLAFHAFPAAAPGGFAGVDVFFVISGFLISGIILDGLRSGSFTFANFYWRRIRRIFPALVLVLAASLALGWRLLLPDEYRELGRHVAAGAGFVSNFALWREAGYFDPAAELKPLLHLWSLGVEEQYYLVWPLLLFLFRGRPRQMLWMILGFGALSFAVNVWTVSVRPSAAFYLPVTRFWELLAGSALAYVTVYRPAAANARLADLKAFVGMASVAASLALLDGERAFPGWWALLPVIGSALLISAGPAAWVNRRILAHRSLVFIGLISYPLYLWHWPLLAYARIVEDGEPAVALRLALLAASALLAWATYELVEKRIRFGSSGAAPRIAVPTLAASMTAVGLYGLVALQGYLRPHSAALPLVNEISRASSDWEYRSDRVIPGDTPRAVLFFGDSHMQHYWPRVHKIVSERAAPVRTVIFKTSGGCAPVPGIERKSRRCSKFVADGLALALRPEVETVVIAASWVGFINRPDYFKVGDARRTPLRLLAPGNEWVLDGFESALRTLVASGKRVVLVLSSPRGEAFDPKSVIHRNAMTVQVRSPLALVPRSEVSALTKPIDERLRRVAAAVGASVIDPSELLCSAAFCAAADEQGRPLYKDATHLRASAARERFDAVDRYVYLR